MEYVVFFIPLILSIGHAVGHLVNLRDRKYTEMMQSFAAGFAIGFIFLVLIPEITALEPTTEYSVMMFVFIGFVAFHAALKYMSLHPELENRRTLNNEVHLLVIAMYNLLVTFSIMEIAQNDLLQGLIFTLLFSFHLTTSELAEHGERGNLPNSTKITVLIVAVVLGSILPYFDFVSDSVTAALFSLAAGGIIYISVREEIPMQNSGRPIFFLLGSVAILAFAFLMQLV